MAIRATATLTPPRWGTRVTCRVRIAGAEDELAAVRRLLRNADGMRPGWLGQKGVPLAEFCTLAEAATGRERQAISDYAAFQAGIRRRKKHFGRHLQPRWGILPALVPEWVRGAFRSLFRRPKPLAAVVLVRTLKLPGE